MNALPSWIEQEAWDGFVEMRKAKRHVPWTARAEKLILAELYKLHDRGHDANKALDLSTVNGWSDVYPPKEKDIPNMKREVYKQEKATPEEWAKSEEARLKVMGKVNSVIKLVQ